MKPYLLSEKDDIRIIALKTENEREELKHSHEDLNGIFYVFYTVECAKEFSLTIEVPDGQYMESEVRADFQRAFPDCDVKNFHAKIEINNLALSAGYLFFLNWLNPKNLIIQSANDHNIIDWKQIPPPHEEVQIQPGAECLLNSNFFLELSFSYSHLFSGNNRETRMERCRRNCGGMEHICALLDNQLKSAIVQNVFDHLKPFQIMSWCTLSRFWQSECIRQFKSIELSSVDNVVLIPHKVKDADTNENGEQNRSKFPPTDLSPFFFVLFNVRKLDKFCLRLSLPDGHLYEHNVVRDFKKTFPELEVDNFSTRINIETLSLSAYNMFFMKWLNPRSLVIIEASETNKIDWKEIPAPHELVKICAEAESLLKPDFFANMKFPHLNCFLTSFGKLDLKELVYIVKEWCTGDRTIKHIYIEGKHDTVQFVENFDIFEKLNILLALIGPFAQIVPHPEHNPPALTAARLNVRNEDSTKVMCISVKKTNNTKIMLSIHPRSNIM